MNDVVIKAFLSWFFFVFVFVVVFACFDLWMLEPFDAQ